MSINSLRTSCLLPRNMLRWCKRGVVDKLCSRTILHPLLDYLTRVTLVCCCLPFCGCRHLATSRESKAHFVLPGYAPGTIAVNVTWMEKGFNVCQKYRSMYPSIFNRLRAIARYWSEIATFSYPLHLTPPLWVFPLEFRGRFWTSEN